MNELKRCLNIPSMYWEWIHLFLMIVIAAYLRFQGLGSLSFYGDEELSALAVQGILADGYPHMPSGMAYFRAIPYSYLAAGSAIICGFKEFSLRLPSAIFGLLTIPVFYGLAKRLIGLMPATLAGWLLVFSSWHIDMSREARMYSMFLFSFLLCLFCFEQGYLRGRKSFIVLTVLTGILTLMLHLFGVFVVLFLCIAGVVLRRSIKYRGFLLGTIIGLVTYWFIYSDLIKFTFPGPPVDVPAKVTGIFYLLKLMQIQFVPHFYIIRHVLEHSPVVYCMLCFVALLVTFYFVWKINKKRGQLNLWIVLVLVSFTIFALLNLFGMILFGLLTLLLLKTNRIKDLFWENINSVRSVVFYFALLFSFWFIYGLLIWQGDGVGVGMSIELAKNVIKDSLGYPAMHIMVYLRSFPIMTLLMCCGSVMWVLSFNNNDDSSFICRIIFLWFWLSLFFIGLNMEWVALRYTLPIYPFYIMIFAWTICHIVALVTRMIRRIVPQVSLEERYTKKILVVLFAVMFVYPVANPLHGIWDAIATSRLSYGQHISPSFHGFPFHPDHQGVGNYVKANLLDEDIVVAFDVQQQQCYVGRVDYWIRNPEDAKTYSFLQDDLWRDVYTGAVVIKSLEELQDLLGKRSEKRVWIITSGELFGSLAYMVPFGVQEHLSQREQNKVFVGRDNKSSVYLFDSLVYPMFQDIKE